MGLTQADGNIDAGTYWFDVLTGGRPIPPFGIDRFETYADTAELEAVWSDFVRAPVGKRYPVIEGIGIEVLEWVIGDPPVYLGTGPSTVYFDNLTSNGSVPVELLSFVVE